jgi:hypothetical protein
MLGSTAVLDACVLVPVALADTMLRVAEKGLYRPLWSDRILREAQLAIEEIHPGITVDRRFDSMREAFSDALVTGWEALEPRTQLPDRDERAGHRRGKRSTAGAGRSRVIVSGRPQGRQGCGRRFLASA